MSNLSHQSASENLRQKRKLILASAYTYARELKVRRARDLRRPRLQVAHHVAYADEHGTPAQRLYNLLCIAYGSDIKLFADLGEKQFLLRRGRSSARTNIGASILLTAR